MHSSSLSPPRLTQVAEMKWITGPDRPMTKTLTKRRLRHQPQCLGLRTTWCLGGGSTTQGAPPSRGAPRKAQTQLCPFSGCCRIRRKSPLHLAKIGDQSGVSAEKLRKRPVPVEPTPSMLLSRMSGNDSNAWGRCRWHPGPFWVAEACTWRRHAAAKQTWGACTKPNRSSRQLSCCSG